MEKVSKLLTVFFLSIGLQNICYAKKVIIFTATSDIGKAAIHEIYKENDLFITGRNESKLNEIAKLKSNIKTFKVDFSNLETCKSFAKNISGTVDAVVVIPPRITCPAPNIIPNEKEWQNMLNMLFINPISCLKMLESNIANNASIVFISGVSSVDFMPNYINTNIARQAMILEAKNIAFQWKDKKVRVNTISPGIILTSFHAKKMTKEEFKKSEKVLPKAEDLAHLISFLVSEQSKYINGQNIIYDNGSHFLNTQNSKA